MKNEINWNLESQNLLFYLNNKPVSFYKWNKYLDLSSSIKYTVLQDLIDNDYAVLKHDETNVSVEPEGIYYLIENIGLETTRKLFNFPEYSDFYTVVESTSTDISSKDFTLSYRHFSNIDPFPINPQRYFPNSVFWTSDSKNIALMRKEEFELIDKLEKFNNRGNCTLSEQYQRYGDIQKLIKSSSHLAIETPLQGQSVFIPEKMELDLNTEQDQIQIQVNITDSNPEKDYIQQNFNERLDATNDTQLVYTIPTKKGGTDRIHIPFTEAQREQLHKVRSHNFEARNGKNIGDVLSHPEKYFDLSEIDISSTFSERVIGLGEYQPKTKSFSVQINNEWFPGIEIDDPVEGTQNIVFENEQELNQFSEDIKRAKESNKQTVPYKNYQIPLEEAIQIQQISEDQFRTPDRPVSPKKQVLLISENLDELEYSEEKQLNDVGDNFWAIPNLSSEYDLKSHQKVGIGWMQELFRQDAPGCLLADDMGLGKTLQVMSFLEWAVSELDKPCKALILAPKSLLQNWENEYFRFFPTGNYRTIRLGSDEKEYSKKISYHAETWGQNTLVITNYETLRFNQIEFGKIKWDIVVADEAQKIKTPGTLVTNASKALNTDFRIALTGTPVENTFQDLWCLMDFCLPGLLGSRKDFNKHFSESKNATDEDLIEIGKKIREKIGPYILRRNKSILGNELPSKYISNIEEHHDHFPIDCSTLQRLMPITQKRAYDEVIEMMQASKDKRMTL
ncbi:MAG: DEAD/DEAH box helicase, partial [Spirochaetales bacterium]|nr:DEAD/DEAH box helicase [Spirochaetales bacterium]